MYFLFFVHIIFFFLAVHSSLFVWTLSSLFLPTLSSKSTGTARPINGLNDWSGKKHSSCSDTLGNLEKLGGLKQKMLTCYVLCLLSISRFKFQGGKAKTLASCLIFTFRSCFSDNTFSVHKKEKKNLIGLVNRLLLQSTFSREEDQLPSIGSCIGVRGHESWIKRSKPNI